MGDFSAKVDEECGSAPNVRKCNLHKDDRFCRDQEYSSQQHCSNIKVFK